VNKQEFLRIFFGIYVAVEKVVEEKGEVNQINTENSRQK